MSNLTYSMLAKMASAGVRQISVEAKAYADLCDSMKGLLSPELALDTNGGQYLAGIEIYLYEKMPNNV